MRCNVTNYVAKSLSQYMNHSPKIDPFDKHYLYPKVGLRSLQHSREKCHFKKCTIKSYFSNERSFLVLTPTNTSQNPLDQSTENLGNISKAQVINLSTRALLMSSSKKLEQEAAHQQHAVATTAFAPFPSSSRLLLGETPKFLRGLNAFSSS